MHRIIRHPRDISSRRDKLARFLCSLCIHRWAFVCVSDPERPEKDWPDERVACLECGADRHVQVRASDGDQFRYIYTLHPWQVCHDRFYRRQD